MIIFIYAKDSFRGRQKLDELKNKYFHEIDNDKNNLITIDGEKTTLTEINDVINTSSLFVRKKMVVIKDLFSNKDRKFIKDLNGLLRKFEEKDKVNSEGREGALGQESEDKAIIIIFEDASNTDKKPTHALYKFLAKLKFAQILEPLSSAQATNWIKKEALERGAELRHDAGIRLTGLFGNDLWYLSNELDKLIGYKTGLAGNTEEQKKETVIEVDDVINLSRGKADENIFAFTDAVSRRKKDEALALLEKEIEAGVAEQYISHMVLRQFKILLQVKQALDKGIPQRAIATELKIHPFVVQKSIGQSRNFSLLLLKRIVIHLVKIDSEIKTGKNDYLTAVCLMMAKL